eukprot:jgi/Chlat1/8083/Chrsp75S07543
MRALTHLTLFCHTTQHCRYGYNLHAAAPRFRHQLAVQAIARFLPHKDRPNTIIHNIITACASRQPRKPEVAAEGGLHWTVEDSVFCESLRSVIDPVDVAFADAMTGPRRTRAARANNATIVTAFYAMRSKHTPEEYWLWSKNMLGINTPMVVFVDDDIPALLPNSTAFQIRQIRVCLLGGAIHHVIVNVTSLQGTLTRTRTSLLDVLHADRPNPAQVRTMLARIPQLPSPSPTPNTPTVLSSRSAWVASGYTAQLQAQQDAISGGQPDSWMPMDLRTLYHQKAGFVRRVASSNPFQTRYFVWTDVGCFRDTHVAYIGVNWPDGKRIRRLDDNRLLVARSKGRGLDTTLCKARQEVLLDELVRDIVERQNYDMAGAIWAGTLQAVEWWATAYYRALEKLLTIDGPVYNDDQTIMTLLRCWHPRRVRVLPAAEDGDGDGDGDDVSTRAGCCRRHGVEPAHTTCQWFFLQLYLRDDTCA